MWVFTDVSSVCCIKLFGWDVLKDLSRQCPWSLSEQFCPTGVPGIKPQFSVTSVQTLDSL